MNFYNIISIYFILMSVAILYSVANIKSLNGAIYSKVAVLLSLAICSYVLGYAMEINSENLSQILFWNKFQYLGIPFISALWFTIGLMYTGHFYRHKALLLLAVYVVPIISAILRFTNDYHYLYFSSIDFSYTDGKVLFLKAIGPWATVQTIHSMSMIVIAQILFMKDCIKSKEKKRCKTILICISSFVALLGLILSYIRPFKYIIDYMAVCLPAASVTVMLSILYCDFLEIKSLARNKAFESNEDAILLINRQYKILDYNKKAEELFRYQSINLAEGRMDLLFNDNPNLLEKLKNNTSSIIKMNINSKPMYYKISTNSIGTKNFAHGSAHGWIKTLRNVTEEYKLNKRLNRLAMTDELSGLRNRRAFMKIGEKVMHKATSEGKTIHLMMVDLDFFKKINDQYGHRIGDKVIRHISNTLKEIFSSNSLVARLGGDEFVLLSVGLSDDEIKHKVEDVLNKVSNHKHYSPEGMFNVTISIGIVKKSSNNQNLDSLLHKVDKALYKSKDSGRNCYTI